MTDGHVGDERLATVHLRPSASDPKRLAQPNEFRIALDVGYEIEHLNSVVANAALVAEHGQGFADLLRSALAGLQAWGPAWERKERPARARH